MITVTALPHKTHHYHIKLKHTTSNEATSPSPSEKKREPKFHIKAQEMKDEGSLQVTKKETPTSDSGLFGKSSYKFMALVAMLLLAFWSMFTGTVYLRWSGTVKTISHDLHVAVQEHLEDVLEMEEREKEVKHMWNVYSSNRRMGLPRFWQEAFEAAYEDLSSDVPEVRDAAITEIASMSLRSFHLHFPTVTNSKRAQEFSKSLTQDEKRKAATSERA